jgi:uncharacterized membrane protein
MMAATFLFTGLAKLSCLQVTVDAFAALPVGQWFRFVTGTLEVVGALALLTPPVSGLGALLLLLVDVGAFFAELVFIHVDWIHNVVIAVPLAALVYLQRDSIRERLGARRAEAHNPH